MGPHLRDTPQLKPKSQSPFAEGHCPCPAEDTDPSLAQAQPGHMSGGVQGWQWDGIEPRTSQLGAGHAAPDSRRELLLHACENMYPSNHTSKHVPRELHDSDVI